MVDRFLRGDPKAVGTVDGFISGAACLYERRLADHWDDVLQKARQEVIRLLGEGKFRGESSLRTYLWRVVSHTCLDQIRALSRWERKESPRSQEGFKPEKQEDRDVLLQVLRSAPQDCRELWRMVVAGLSYREMSLRLNVPEGTLRFRIIRCRERAMAARQELLRGKSSALRVRVPEQISSGPAELILSIDPAESEVPTESAPAEAVQRFKSLQVQLAADPRPLRDLPPEEKKERLRLIQGIGRGLFSTSEEFKRQKQEEIDLEERHRAY